ncbi:TonB family protein [Haliangium ochraceum]|uniref:TonB family protein n=1 Tax=Haliangium ochraceum (strain DSM 14365 / JCM 11303 / SMP-2) TaxID=502025 RepID=D0LHB3_HALO1|nr:TonB family protein [Haliangium ochraceum]ACY18258.1 hypothetical protein Hoch_5781 [Haliangium ochraceum DSM 14365]
MNTASFAVPSMRGTRNEDSLLFSVPDAVSASSDRPNSGRDGARVSNSGILDIGALRARYADEAEAATVAGSPSALAGAWLLVPQAQSSGPSLRAMMFAALGGVAAASALVAVALSVAAPDLVQRLFPSASAPAQSVASAPPAAPTPTPAPALIPPLAAAADDDADEDDDALPGELADTTETDNSSEIPRESVAQAPSKPASTRSTTTRTTRTPSKPAQQTRKPAAPAASEEPAVCMEEVACLLASNPPACCSRYDSISSSKPGSAPQSAPDLPESLGRTEIQAGINKVRDSVRSCARLGGSGTVSLSVRVNGEGRVSSIDLKSAPNDALGACVVDAVEGARFPASQNGQRFTYPFVF